MWDWDLQTSPFPCSSLEGEGKGDHPPATVDGCPCNLASMGGLYTHICEGSGVAIKAFSSRSHSSLARGDIDFLILPLPPPSPSFLPLFLLALPHCPVARPHGTLGSPGHGEDDASVDGGHWACGKATRRRRPPPYFEWGGMLAPLLFVLVHACALVAQARPATPLARVAGAPPAPLPSPPLLIHSFLFPPPPPFFYP